MKTLFSLIGLLFTLWTTLSTPCSAQIVPFKASQGVPTAASSVKSDGLSNAKLTSIATLGDTTFFGSYLDATVKGLISFSFDPKNGNSSFWGYQFHDLKNGKDTSDGAIVLKLFTFYNPIATPLPSLPNLPIRLDSALPSSYMDSDTMSAKISRNKLYTSSMLAHPSAKFQAIALGMSTGDITPGGPLWIAFIGDKQTNPSLECYVPADNNSGAAVCIDVPAATAVEDQPVNDRITVFPNPATQGRVHVHIPLSCYQPRLDITISNLLGDALQHRTIESIGGGIDVDLDVRELSSGMYLLRLGGSTRQVVLPFLLEL